MSKCFEDLKTCNYKFFQHKECEFFPCHQTSNEEKFNCLFCYCPLYFLDDCGGGFVRTKAGVKDCTGCLIPHLKYDFVIERLRKHQDLLKK